MATTFGHEMPFGAWPSAHGVRFRLWAPDCRTVSLCLETERGDRLFALDRDADGWWQTHVDEARAGTRYRYEIDGRLRVPDAASRFQPQDVHGPSEVVDPTRYQWIHGTWQGRPWEETVLYEAHVGTATPEGTFRGLMARLPELVDLGVTALELMPVNDFPGRWDWGYNGVCLFAPDSSYGRPDDLKALIDAAHGLGLMVFLDVVYNHFGPDGNYLYVYAKSHFFNEDRHTPWGAAINFDGPGARVVRDFFIENALYWLEEFRIDGLRFDAVHAIEDRSEPDILEEIATRVQAAIPAERHVHLVLENDHNQSRYLERDAGGRPRYFRAQWNDDIHHAYHVLLTGEEAGYYADYADDPAKHLRRCLTEGFAYQGDPSPFRAGAPRGEPSAHLPLPTFVAFIQNHDQIGNRAFGERIGHLSPPEAITAAVAVLLLAPSIPLLFMGEEWLASAPFQFFCDLSDDLKQSVRDGRRREFASFPQFRDAEAQARIPDPTAEVTFRRSALAWSERARSPHRETLALYHRLLALRRVEITPRLAGMQGHAGRVLWAHERAMLLNWRLGDGSQLTLLANVAGTPAPGPVARPQGRMIYASRDGVMTEAENGLGPWTVAWFLDQSQET